MGKIYTGNGWLIRVQGREHPPVHAHVYHPDGKALIELDGTCKNNGVPPAVLKIAISWVLSHPNEVRAEWARMNDERS